MAQPESNERKWVLLLCLLAAVHVFIFSAAFPFFNNMDETYHFDLVVKYSHGNLPRGIGPMGEESSLYTMTYASPEFMHVARHFPGGRYPTPFWMQSTNAQSKTSQREAAFQKAAVAWRTAKNLQAWKSYESSQPPLYYAVTGLWWHIGQWLGFTGLQLLYWVRFLNILFVVSLVQTGYFAARMIFPENLFLRIGVPALLAFIPQTVFYSIENDVLSPLCFGLAFMCLLKWLSAENPGIRLGIFTGLALAATFLAKLSNLPLLAGSGIFLALNIFRLAKNGKGRAARPALTALILCAGLPVGGWLAWTKYAFGDFTGTAEKIQFLTWTLKPFHEWWHHPLFSPQGFWTFISELLATFWQGEFQWHGQSLGLPVVDAVYVILTICFFALTLVGLHPRFSIVTGPQRQALWLSFLCLAAAIVFTAFLSVIYDFGLGTNPSQDHPYFTSGRLILGALIPFLLLYLYGLDYLLRDLGNNWVRFVALAGMISFMLISESVIDWPVFASQYNWYHL